MFTNSQFCQFAMSRMAVSLIICSIYLSACGTASNTDLPDAKTGDSTPAAGNTASGAGENATAVGAQHLEDVSLKGRLSQEKGVLAAAPRASISIYTEQAKAGDSDSQTRLAVCHYIGSGTEVNKGEAKKWFAIASEANNKKAQYCLAYMLEHGEGGPENKREAFRWYQIAAEGHDRYSSLAEEEVKRLSSDFDDVEKDRISKEVLEWFKLNKHRKTKADKTRRSW